ncbi:MAG: hypothetical protein ABW022_12820 [Actinoplanes sp.]
MNVRIGALVMSVCLVGGCTWAGGDGRDRNPDNQPRYVTGRDDSEHREIPHRVRGDGDATVFQLVNGTDVVRVRLGDLGTDRYEVSTPDNSRVVPAVTVQGGEIVAGVRDSGAAGPAVVDVVLSSSVRWQIRLAGGAADSAVDLTGGPGGDVDFSAGTARAAVTLPAGKGTQRVVLGGGAGTFSVRLGGDEPVRVRAGGGAGSVTIDGKTHGGVSGGTVWAPANWQAATDRYDIDATAGVSSIAVSRG